MIKKQNLLGFIDSEKHLLGEQIYPAWRRFLFQVLRLRPCNEGLVRELDFIQEMIDLGIFDRSVDKKGLQEALARQSHSQWMEWSKAIAEFGGKIIDYANRTTASGGFVLCGECWQRVKLALEGDMDQAVEKRNRIFHSGIEGDGT